mmetsp:Transcript_64850/g.122996  ORF Transcript_64850/g.122996 Transcript_64850/m.122996 type:complete len:304 (-) Transcript_64850:342-1253(-)
METPLPSFHLRSPASDASAAALLAVLSDYSSEIDALLSQTQSPPSDKSERNVWATTVKKDCERLIDNMFRLSTDAQQAARFDVPGAQEVCAKVDTALMSCARCYRLANEAVQTWSAEQAFRLDSQHTLETIHEVAMVLDQSAYNTISQAVEDLNAGIISCPEGWCIVRSLSEVYFVLFRSDKREQALMLFDPGDEPTRTWSEAAGREFGVDRYHFGDVCRMSVRATKTNMLDWATREKTKEGYEFGDLFLKRLACAMFGGSSYMSQSDMKETADRLEDLNSWEQSMRSVIKFDSKASAFKMDT